MSIPEMVKYIRQKFAKKKKKRRKLSKNLAVSARNKGRK